MEIQMMTITGNVKDGYVECKRADHTLWAKPMAFGGLVSFPQSTWTEAYKKKQFGLVAYVGTEGNKSPILIGLIPVNQSPYTDENVHTFRSAQFEMTFNDEEKHFSVVSKSHTASIHIKEANVYVIADTINLGSESAAEKTLLGETTKSLIEDLIDILKVGKINTAIGPQSFMPPTQLKLSLLKDQLETMLSEKVKND